MPHHFRQNARVRWSLHARHLERMLSMGEVSCVSPAPRQLLFAELNRFCSHSANSLAGRRTVSPVSCEMDHCGIDGIVLTSNGRNETLYTSARDQPARFPLKHQSIRPARHPTPQGNLPPSVPVPPARASA